MKYIPYAIVIILTAVLMFFIMRSCSEESSQIGNSRETELLQNIEQLETDITILKAKNDSLETVKQKVKTQIVEQEAIIDLAILGDSVRARNEFNKSLVENGELPDPIPDNPHYVSFKDLGLSAKLMRRIPKMQLQINLCEEQSFNKDKIIEDKDFQINSYKDLNDIKDKNVAYYKDLYEDGNTFWSSTEFGILIGVTASVALVFITGLAK